MNLEIYWHVYLANHWREIVWEQLDLLWKSGLLTYASRINVSIIDPDECLLEFLKMTHSIEKICIVSVKSNPKEYEFITLQKMHEHAKKKASGAVMYMHTKGASYPDDCQKQWRDVCHDLIRNWRIYHEGLRVADVSGPNYINRNDDRWHPHFSGNFWMANRDYIYTLDFPKTSEDRFEAEWWVCSKTNQVYSMPFVEHHCKSPNTT